MNEFYEFILIHYLMSNFNFADCRKAVNQATFRPTAARKAAAAKLLSEALDFINNLEEVKESSKKTTKRRRKTTKKATPQQRVADRQEKAFHGKADSPVKPSKTARKADVAKAAAAAKAVSVATGAAAKAAKKAELKAQAETADKVASLEAKIEALTAVLALHMESTTLPSANEVSIDELPFEL
jgi:hypothetical protein